MSGTSEKLMELAQRGDQEAFERLIEPHRDKLRSWLTHTLGDREEALDAEAEVLLRCWTSLKSFKGGSEPGTWIFAICKNVLKERYRLRDRDRRLRERLGLEHGLRPFELGPEDLLLSRTSQRKQTIVAALDSIPERQRRIVMLRVFSGRSLKEAGEELGVTPDAAKMLYFRAVRSLRAELKKRGALDD